MRPFVGADHALFDDGGRVRFDESRWQTMTDVKDPWEFREALRLDLRAALKSRDLETISALRSMIAVIDNAEAVPAGADPPRLTNGAIAHSSRGVGSTEAPRRKLRMNDIRTIVRGLVAEYHTQGEHYRTIHQHGSRPPCA